MIRKLYLLALVSAILLSAAPVLADGDFYVVGGGGGVGTKITSVPYTISTPGFYYLGGNLNYSSPGNAITISSHGVTLDLMGFCITGPGYVEGAATGVRISANFTNVEIRNGSIKDFATDTAGQGGIVSADSTNNIRVNGVRVMGWGNTTGIGLYGINNVVQGCMVYNCQNGIWITSNSIAKNNHVTGNSAGDGIRATTGCTITGNVSNNNVYGIHTDNSCTVLDNTTVANTSYGIYVGAYCTVARNTAIGSPVAEIRTGNQCSIVGNTAPTLVKGTKCVDANNATNDTP